MSDNRSYVPRSIDHFALLIVAKFGLNKAGSIGFIERIIREAVEEEQKTVREREQVGCLRCRIMLLRYQTVRGEFKDSCPECREPMLSMIALHRKKIADLEELLKQAGCIPENPPQAG